MSGSGLFNVRRGNQTLSANLNTMILFDIHELFFILRKQSHCPKGMDLEIWTSNKRIKVNFLGKFFSYF